MDDDVAVFVEYLDYFCVFELPFVSVEFGVLGDVKVGEFVGGGVVGGLDTEVVVSLLNL